MPESVNVSSWHFFVHKAVANCSLQRAISRINQEKKEVTDEIQKAGCFLRWKLWSPPASPSSVGAGGIWGHEEHTKAALSHRVPQALDRRVFSVLERPLRACISRLGKGDTHWLCLADLTPLGEF